LLGKTTDLGKILPSGVRLLKMGGGGDYLQIERQKSPNKGILTFLQTTGGFSIITAIIVKIQAHPKDANIYIYCTVEKPAETLSLASS
jgi:hypothetical protein